MVERLKNLGDPWYIASPVTVLKIFVQYIQIVGVICTVYTGVQWPGEFRSASGALSILSSNPFAVAMPSCVDSSWVIDAYVSFRIAIFLPMIALTAVLVYYLVIIQLLPSRAMLAVPYRYTPRSGPHLRFFPSTAWHRC